MALSHFVQHPAVSALRAGPLLPLWGEEWSAAGRSIGNDLSIEATNPRSHSEGLVSPSSLPSKGESGRRMTAARYLPPCGGEWIFTDLAELSRRLIFATLSRRKSKRGAFQPPAFQCPSLAISST